MKTYRISHVACLLLVSFVVPLWSAQYSVVKRFETDQEFITRTAQLPLIAPCIAEKAWPRGQQNYQGTLFVLMDRASINYPERTKGTLFKIFNQNKEPIFETWLPKEHYETVAVSRYGLKIAVTTQNNRKFPVKRNVIIFKAISDTCGQRLCKEKKIPILIEGEDINHLMCPEWIDFNAQNNKVVVWGMSEGGYWVTESQAKINKIFEIPQFQIGQIS